MKPSRVVALLLLSLLVTVSAPSWAGKISQDSLIGTWEFDLFAAMEEQMKSMGQEVTPEMKAMFDGSFMRIHFAKSGDYTFTAKMPMGEESETGTWKVTKTEENTLTVSTVDDEEKVEEVSITFADADNFEASMNQQGQKVTLKATRIKVDSEKE